MQVWPNLGLHHALTSKLALLLRQPEAAVTAAAAAAEILYVTHAGGAVLSEVMRMQFEAQQELAAWQRMKSG